MIDKIQNGLPSGYTNGINNADGKPGVMPTQHVQKQSSHSAEVSLSNDALALQRIMQAVREAPDVRADIVQEIKGQIETGAYTVNAESLAGKLLPFVR